MLKLRRHLATVVVASALVVINLGALNWSRMFFDGLGRRPLLAYGDKMPRLEGPDYTGRHALSVGSHDFTLVLYFAGPRLSGRAVSLLKYGEALQRERGADGFHLSVITSGALPEVQELLQDNFVTFNIIDDSDGALARRLRLAPGDDGTFLFDKEGSCRFSARQQIGSEDLRQLLAAEGLAPVGTPPAGTARVARGGPLPALRLTDARTLGRTTAGEVASGGARVWVFFPADCFSCGAPDMRQYMPELNYWRKSHKEEGAEPILVFDSAFTRGAVLQTLDGSRIKWPAYISDDDLGALSRLAQSAGGSLGKLVLVRTNESGEVTSTSMIRPPGSPGPAAAEAQSRGAAGPPAERFRRTLQNPALDVYDVDSYRDLYVVSDRTRNSILVLNGESEILKEISGIGSAPEKIFRPGHLDVAADGNIYVEDGGNERIQSFDLEGRHLGGFVTSEYTGFAAGTGGEVYLSQPQNGSLISVYSRDGKLLRSFGALKTFSEIYGPAYAHRDKAAPNAINSTRLTTDGDGNILVSFMLAPIIQKYTRRGELIFERVLEGPEIDRLAEMVVTDSAESYLTMTLDGGAQRVMALEATALPGGEIHVTLTDGSVYVASHDGRRLRVVRPQDPPGFTPDMTGLSPAGELVVVSLIKRECYLLPRQAE